MYRENQRDNQEGPSETLATLATGRRQTKHNTEN